MAFAHTPPAGPVPPCEAHSPWLKAGCRARRGRGTARRRARVSGGRAGGLAVPVDVLLVAGVADGDVVQRHGVLARTGRSPSGTGDRKGYGERGGIGRLPTAGALLRAA